MAQRWANLLFLHWRVKPELLEDRLPKGLHLDLHEGMAWLGIVPFSMQRIRPYGLIPLPWLSWFLELNVRTYVVDENGIPGVWFFSLDCNQPLAVEYARYKFHLPYQHASMSSRKQNERIHYSCRRKSRKEAAEYIYSSQGHTSAATEGSLEFFLAERYLLISCDREGHLHYGRVHHSPYQLAPANLDRWSPAPIEWNGIPAPTHQPDSALWADPVDVTVYPLQSQP